MSTSVIKQVEDLLGAQSQSLLGYVAKGFPRESLHLPGPDFVDRVVSLTDRSPAVLRNFQTISESLVGWRERVMFRSCRSIRASSTRPARASRRTRFISIRKTS